MVAVALEVIQVHDESSVELVYASSFRSEELIIRTGQQQFKT
jgi:hypothetical protein